ncbi:MAG: MerR family transcriptional regulator [Stecheria intestinalis]|nr:MerR family transcriptional regulator [Stecheria intestinalis]
MMDELDKSSLIPIGRMAEINHMTAAALRLYDEKGLLKPRYVDPDTGCRYYDWNQNARLDMIASMKELGMTLQEIHEIFEKKDMDRVEELLAERNEQLYEQRRAIKEQQKSIQRAIRSMERFRKSPVTGMVSLEYIEQRYFWGIPCTGNFYTEGLTCFEQNAADLRNELVELGFSQIHTYSIATSVQKDLFLERKFCPDLVFVFVDRDQCSVRNDIRVADSGMYACIYAEDFSEEQDYACRLLSLYRENSCQIAGDYFCEIMTEFNVFDENRRGMFMRLQVPLHFVKNHS